MIVEALYELHFLSAVFLEELLVFDTNFDNGFKAVGSKRG